MNKREWVLRPNCSLTPRQLACAYLVLCALSFAVAGLFAVRGAWCVLAFTTIEMLIVAVAFLNYARHAVDHERIILDTDGCVVVEKQSGGKMQRTVLASCWLRIAVPVRYGDLIQLESQGAKVKVGSCVTQSVRQRVAGEIRAELNAGWTGGGEARA